MSSNDQTKQVEIISCKSTFFFGRDTSTKNIKISNFVREKEVLSEDLSKSFHLKYLRPIIAIVMICLSYTTTTETVIVCPSQFTCQPAVSWINISLLFSSLAIWQTLATILFKYDQINIWIEWLRREFWSFQLFSPKDMIISSSIIWWFSHLIQSK